MKNLHNALMLKQLYQLKQLGYRYTDMQISQQIHSNLELPSTLDALRKQSADCHLCPLSKTRHSVVFGEGDENADILFVGEAPGAAEDGVGKPFVGKSGELLTKMIENVLRIPRSQVYITNIVKCRPQNNRVPSATEAHTCLAYLRKQIESINPKIIVTLGATAYHYLSGDESKITQIRGTLQQWGAYRVVPTFHPSYLLRNPSAKADAFADMKLIKSLYEK